MFGKQLNLAKMDVLAIGENSTNCNNFSNGDKNRILIAKGGTGLLTFSMCLIAVSIVLRVRLYKHFSYRLAMYQILSSLCLSVVEVSFITLRNETYQQKVCKTTAFLLDIK